MLLSPLAELSAIPFPDVRQKQLDTVLHILHASGEILSHGWPLILTMIGALGKCNLYHYEISSDIIQVTEYLLTILTIIYHFTFRE